MSRHTSQGVCPWNARFQEPSVEEAHQSCPDTDGPALVDLMGMSEEAFSSRFSGSPIKRAKRRGFLRNVAVALGNWGSLDGVPVLTGALYDPEPLIRGHAAWALGRILNGPQVPEPGRSPIVETLATRLGEEEDPWVRQELAAAAQVHI